MNGEADNGSQDAAECIRVHGARTHNLQNLDLALPRDRLVVITGPSGSGKSSLAFDTLYAEGQRQYIESLSVYARQFLHQMERPDVDHVPDLAPRKNHTIEAVVDRVVIREGLESRLAESVDLAIRHGEGAV